MQKDVQIPMQATMVLLIAAWRVVASKYSIAPLIRACQTILVVIPTQNQNRNAAKYSDLQRIASEVERAAMRASKLIPGANCFHRALASRIILAMHGIHSTIVIGFRKNDVFEGHAWIEINHADNAPLTLFKTDQDRYQRSFCENSLPDKGRS